MLQVTRCQALGGRTVEDRNAGTAVSGSSHPQDAGHIGEAQETKKVKIHQALLQAFMFSRSFVGDTFLWNCLEIVQ